MNGITYIRCKPYKVVCKKCGFSKVIYPESGCLRLGSKEALYKNCPKCNIETERQELGFLDNAVRTAKALGLFVAVGIMLGVEALTPKNKK